MKPVTILIDYLKTVNYALFHNRLAVCRELEIRNDGATALEDVSVGCAGEYVKPFESLVIPRIEPGTSVRVQPFEIAPDGTKLGALTEKVITDFTITVRAGGMVISEEKFDIELLPYDHWLGTEVLPQTIASFIVPNHPAINAMVLETAAALKEMTGSSVLAGYQTGNPNDVRAQVAAAFAALHRQNIVYRGLPASFEDKGQRLTMPDRVLASRIGNCVELTLLMASVLEAVGLNCLVIFQKGHAYLGVWLVDDCYSCSVGDDASFIEKKCSRGISEMLVLECTQICQEKTSFEDAVKIAEKNLADHSVFQMFVDVKRSRLERILPLPTRVDADGTSSFDLSGVQHDECEPTIEVHDRYDLSRLAEGKHELTKYDIWERKLLDFSLRNSLLNLNLRRRAVQFVSFDVNRIEDHLQDGEEYFITFKPAVEISVDTSERLVRSKLYPELRDLISNDIEHRVLHTYQTETETRDVLKNIYRTARNSIEETGANSLFLAIGTLRWFETEQSQVPRYAPLLLLPVEMVYKKGGYYVRTRDEDISLNVTLIEFLRQNYGIRIGGLDPLPTDKSGMDVPLIFATIRDALKDRKRWDVEEECILGTFSFAKFLMWNDIHNHREELAGNPIVKSLVENRLAWTPEADDEDLRHADEVLAPSETALPVAVDSSQLAAVIKGGKGRSFILYGPPGTGKSQTITNLIANALYQGKRVLFVAEKMAALNVVQSRLEKIGLGPFCLELHSNKSTKRHVLEQLDAALKVAHIMEPADFTALADRIFEERKALMCYMTALHRRDSRDGLTLYECVVRNSSLSCEPLAEFRTEAALDSFLAAKGPRGVEELLGGRFEALLKLVGQPSGHPLKGLHLTREMLMNLQETIDRMEQSRAILQQAEAQQEELRAVKGLREKLLRDNSADIFKENPEELRQQWRAVLAKWFIPRFFAKRKFLKHLRQYNKYITAKELDALFEDLACYRGGHENIERVRAVFERYYGNAPAEDELPDSSALGQAIGDLERWPQNKAMMHDWYQWSSFCDELRAAGMSCVIDAMNSAPRETEQMRKAFLKAMYKAKAEEKIAREENLATFQGMLFDEKVASYRRLTEEFQVLTQKELYARLASRVPRVTDSVASSSEIGLLNRNISNGGRGLSLRELFDQIPTLLPRLCPVMLMSPMSVAQFIDLDQDKFDLVVFDEASQMPTSEAVGAIARGKALIVVGDPKQMPPTSFFTSTNVDEEEACIDDMESILEDCRTLEIPSLQLSWHYRSRHESLIAFSNIEYYDGTLITFPSADDQNTRVHFVPVTGFYDKGGKRENRAEAQAIVDEIVRRLRDENLRKQSIGVIAFNIVQQGLIEDLLQEKLDGDKALQDAAAQMYEPIFIKNLENAQGDERDIILFSIGYGPDKDGKVSMNFGPLNQGGGERRLNVAVSRARCEMFVFSTLKSGDIDLRRTKARGVEGLKHFLQYAQTQSLPTAAQSSGQHGDAELAGMIAAELTARGYDARTGVGRSKFKVDVALVDSANPDVYIMGLLLDGEGYRDTQTTRDREIVQPSVLSGLGWKIMRVWSVDWFNNRERLIDRIIECLNQAPEKAPESSPVKSSFVIREDELEAAQSNAREYKACELSPSAAARMSDISVLHKIVATEQPVTFMHLCRRLSALRGSVRVTPTIQRSVRDLAPAFFNDGKDGIWISQADSADYKAYRPNSGRDLSDIPQVELENALCEALAEQIALDEDSLALTAAKKMGFTRRGANVDQALRTAVASLKSSGRVESIGDKLRLA